MSVPALRFKQDDGQDFPEWQEKPFKDVSKINQGLQIPISDRFAEGGENRHFYITNEFLRKDAKNQYFIENPPSSVLCSESDVLMTRTGNTGKVVTNVKGAFHNNFFKISYDRNILIKDFLCEFLCLEHTQSLILKLAGTSTIPDLNHSDFYKIKFRFPSLPEQTKIANFLTAVDEKISLLTQKHDLLSQYKKGVMQQIFSQELRFKDDDGGDFPEWKESILSNIVSSPITYGVVKPDKEDVNGVKLIRGGDVSQGKTSANLRTISKEISQQYKRTILQGGELIVSLVGNPGEVAIVPKDLIGANLARQVGLVRLVKEINSLFVLYFLTFTTEIITSKITGSVQKVINLEDLQKLKIQTPTFVEQTKIANFLTAIDDKITATQSQLEAVKQYKQGLLQQMFV